MERIAPILFDLMVSTASTSSLPPGLTPIPQEYNTGRIRMTSHDLESVALTLVAEGKGILAADETPRKRLAYRVMIRPTGVPPSTRTFLGAPPTTRFGVNEAKLRNPGRGKRAAGTRWAV
jgi:hypothetical protein